MLENKIQKWGLITASIALSWTVIKVEPVQAAFFIFTMNTSNIGYLGFSNSNLTGIGQETIRLSELNNLNNGSINFYYQYQVYRIIQDGFDDFVTIGGWRNDPLFSFNSGELAGIDLDSDLVPFSDSDGRRLPYYSFVGDVSLSIRGDDFQELRTGTEYITYYDYDKFELVTREIPLNNFPTGGGTVNFETIEPIAAIPEPLTLLGVGTAVGFGTFFKRKLAGKQLTVNSKQ